MNNKWTEESAKKAIESVVTEYKSVGARVVAEQLAELATQIQADMQAENERLSGRLASAAEENDALRDQVQALQASTWQPVAMQYVELSNGITLYIHEDGVRITKNYPDGTSNTTKLPLGWAVCEQVSRDAADRNAIGPAGEAGE